MNSERPESENILATHPEKYDLIRKDRQHKAPIHSHCRPGAWRIHPKLQQTACCCHQLVSPGVPPIPGLAGTPYWTSTEALVAEKLPGTFNRHWFSDSRSGTGASLFTARSKVTLLARHTLMYQENAAIGSILQAVMEDEGMTILTHTQPEAVSYKKSLLGSGKFTLKTRSGQILMRKP